MNHRHESHENILGFLTCAFDYTFAMQLVFRCELVRRTWSPLYPASTVWNSESERPNGVTLISDPANEEDGGVAAMGFPYARPGKGPDGDPRRRQADAVIIVIR